MAKDWIYSFLQSGAILRRSNDDYLVGVDLTPTNEGSCGCFFQSDFFLTDTQWLKPTSFHCLSKNELINRLRSFTEMDDTSFPKLDWNVYLKRDFFPVYDDIQLAFQGSQFEKIVPAIYHDATIELSLCHRARLLLSALNYVSGSYDYLYGIWSDRKGMIGVSPEQLLTYCTQSKILCTMALAGTLNSDYPDTKLLQSAKDNHEHALVVQGIQEVLQRFGSVHVGRRQIMTIKSFHHLYTPMSCHFSDQFDFDTVVRALHPTPALGGYPSKPSFQWLCNHVDQRDRSLFGAPFGVCDNQGNYHVVVSIRNVQWQSDRLSVWAGCGIVPESQFESEWAELGAKIDSVKAIFSLK